MPPKRQRESRVYCSVKSCENNSMNSNVSFFRFPKDPERCSTWLENCERMDLAKFTPEHVHNNYRICDVHFADNMFAGLVGDLSRKKLKRTAIPTIKNVPQDIVLKEQASRSILTPLSPLYYCKPEQGTVGTPDQGTSGMPDQSLEQREVCSTEELAAESILAPLSPLYYCEPEQGTSEMSNQSLEQRGECSREELAAGSVLTPLSPLYYCEPEQGTSGIADQSLEEREECSIEDSGTQTPLSLSWDSPRKHELRLKIKKLSMRRRDNQDRQEPHLKKQKVNKEDIFTYLREHFNKGLLTFLERLLICRIGIQKDIDIARNLSNLRSQYTFWVPMCTLI